MKRIITEAERSETVNKGFLVDYLDEVLDSKLEEQLKHIDQRIETLMEHQVHQLQVILESLDDRYVLRQEWLASRGSTR